MKAEPEISVIMANHNGACYLEAAIRSLQAQTEQSWELLFVDDASRDTSLACAARLADSDDRIQLVVLTSQCGPAAARNHGLRRARGRWIAIFDSDDIMQQRRLELLLHRARADGADLVADNLIAFSDRDPAGKPFLPRSLTRAPQWISLVDYIGSGGVYSRVPSFGYLKPLIRHDFLRHAGVVYDEALRIGEDYELVAQLLAVGARYRLEPTAHYWYRRHSASLSYRINGAQIAALLDASDRLGLRFSPRPPELERALRRRRRSLTAMLLYDHLIVSLKAGHYRRAAIIALFAPQIWPLMAEPVGARLVRTASKIRQNAACARDNPDSRHSLETDAEPSIAKSSTVEQ